MSVVAFRTEITDTVRALFELNKLKVVLVSGLLAVAFGVGSSSKVGDYSFLVLTLVPFVCLYVDYQYYHGLAKIFVLARFLSEVSPEIEEIRLTQYYERYVESIRSSAAPGLFAFESKAQIGSSALLTIGCPLLGVLAIATTPASNASPAGLAMMYALSVSSAAGLVLVVWSFGAFRRSLEQMRKVPLPPPPTPLSTKTAANLAVPPAQLGNIAPPRVEEPQEKSGESSDALHLSDGRREK